MSTTTVDSKMKTKRTYTLNNLKAGQHGMVTGIGNVGAIRRRLIDMGITPGAEIIMKKVAPLGDPIEINLRGYELSLRKDEALQVKIVDFK